MKDKSKIKKKKINFDQEPADDVIENAEVIETTATPIGDESHLSTDAGAEAAEAAQAAAHSARDSDSASTDFVDTSDDSVSYPDENSEDSAKEKVKIDFPFSDLVRAQIPKVFDIAETAATQWKHNEKFENLGVPHPIGEIALSKALEKAKEVEKKLEEKGVISAAKMGIAVAEYQVKDLLKKFKKNE